MDGKTVPFTLAQELVSVGGDGGGRRVAAACPNTSVWGSFPAQPLLAEMAMAVTRCARQIRVQVPVGGRPLSAAPPSCTVDCTVLYNSNNTQLFRPLPRLPPTNKAVATPPHPLTVTYIP